MASFRSLARAASVAASLITFAGASAFAADSTLDSAFVTEISPGLTPSSYPTFDSGTGAVNAVALQSGGQILAGGNVSRYKTSGDLSALKRLLGSGAIDTSFNPGGAGLAASSGQPEVNALLVDSSNRIYVGGTFSSYNGSARSGILRLKADGTLDDDYAPAGLGGDTRYAQSLALQPDGKLLVGGSYSSINGNGRSHLARLNTDGTLDFTFTAFAAFSSTFTTAVRDVALLPDGRILVAGLNTASQPVLIRLQSNGALDASFNPGLVASTGAVNKLLLLPDGRVLAAGFFTPSATGQETDLAAFLPDGSLDTTFLANLGVGPNGSVLDLELQPDGTVLASGVFNLWNDQPRASLARLALSGELLANPAPLPYTDNRDNPDLTPFYLTHIYSLAVQPDGKLVAGGWFDRVTDPAVETVNLTRFVNEFAPASPGVIRLLSATATTAENAGSITLQVSRFGGTTGAVAVQFATSTGGANGSATAGSDFTATSGTLGWASGEGGFKTITIPILQDSAAESAETFTVTLSNVTGVATLPAASAKTVVTLRDDDSAPTITRAPAPVTTEQGSRVTFTVRYDSVLPATVQWQRDPDGLGVGAGFADLPGATGLDHVIAVSDPSLHNGHYRAVVTSAAGSTDSAPAELFVAVPAGSVITGFVPPTISEPIVASALDAQGRHLIGSQLGLRRYTVFGELDASFAISTFSSLPVSAVHPLSDGRVLVGGFFTTVNSTSRPVLARFSAEGVLDTAFTPALPSVSGTLYAQTIAPGSGNKYYVGFGSGGGLRRYHADGSHDTSFTATTVGTNLGGIVYAIRERPDGRVLVAHISGANGFGFTYNLSLLEANGTASSAGVFTPPALNNAPRAIDLLPDGRIALGGQFNTVNGVGAARVAILQPDGALDTSFFAPTGVGPDGAVHRIFYREGRLLLAGEFFNIGGQALRGVARVNLDGSLDTTFSAGAGANNSVFTAHLTGQNDLFVAGNFTTFKGVARNRAALLTLNPLIGAIGFAPPRLELTDSAGTALLTLRRYGPATEAASIRYATVDGTATAGADYTAASGTVSWPAGDSSEKTIAITLLEDSAIESTETFRVVLSEPTGPVTPAASATISLLDGDTPASFTAQPSALQANLTVGGPLTLNATVASPTPATYQWFLNGVALPGATALAYSRTSVSLADAGLYTLVVTNAAGAVTSQAVHIVISSQGGRPFPGQPTTGRPQFDSFSGPSSLVALPDGGALIGGLFTANVGLNRPQAYLLRIRADGTTDTSFSLALNAPVVALRAQPDGKILVLGNFTTVNSVAQRYLVRLNANTLSLDTTFNSAAAVALTTTTVPGSASALNLALDSTGRIYVGYSYSGGLIRRLSSAGALDDTYLVGTTGGSPFGLAVDVSDRLLVGGAFSNIGVVAAAGNAPSTSPARAALARLAADGAVDPTFLPAFGSASVRDISIAPDTGRIFTGLDFAPGLVEVDPAGSGTVFNLGNNHSVSETALSPDGRPTLVRSFSGSTAVQRFIPAATLGGSATADSAFSTGTGPNGNVTTLAYRPDGALWIAGDFTTVNGVTTASVALLQPGVSDPGIVNPPARADVNAGATATFAVGATGTSLTYRWFKNGAPLSNDARISGATTAVLRIAGLVASDDDTYTVEVTGGTPSKTVVSAPAKLNVLGAPVVAVSPASVAPALGSTISLAADVLAAVPATYVWKRDGVTIVNGGRYSGATTGTLVIAGANSSDNGAYTLTVTNSQGSVSTTPATVAVAQTPSALFTGFPGLGATSPGNTNNNVNAILHLPDGRTLLGVSGSFRGVTNTSVNAQLVLVDASGNLAATPAGAFNGEVKALHLLPDGKILVAGAFTTVGGVDRSRVARLKSDLTLDDAFVPLTANSGVNLLAVDSLGRIYLYGPGIFSYGGQSGYNGLVRLTSDGALDLDFKIAIGSINALLPLPEGKLLIGGGFANPIVNDVQITANNLVRLNADGTRDTAFNPAFPSGTLTALAVDSSGRVVVSGFETSAYTIKRLLPDGAVDSSFNFTESLNSQVDRLLVLPDGKIVAGGQFTTPTKRLFRLDSDGTRDTAGFDVGNGLTHTNDFSILVNALAPDALGRLWVGGTRFTFYNGSTANALAILQGQGSALAILRQPGGLVADLGGSATFTVSATGNNGLAYQWRKNGNPLSDGGRISGATTASLTVSGLVASDAAAYSVRVSIPGANLVSASAPLTILAEPVVTRSPADATRDVGGSVSFTGAATGAATLAYQWLFEGAPLSDGVVGGVTVAGATTPTLTVSGLTLAQGGAYRLRVTNPHGTATTEPARLKVEKRPGALAAGLPGKTTANNPVLAILRLKDGSMLVGGQFTSVTVNGVSNSRSRLARFLADGTLDPHFTPVINGTVRAIAQDSEERIFIGGDFTGSVTVGGVTASRIRVARISKAFVLDTEFDTSAAGPTGQVSALAPANDGSVYVGGRFTGVGAVTTGVNRMAKLGATGALDAAGFTSYATGDVTTILRLDNGTLYVGGASNTWNTPSLPGSPAGRVVKLNANGSTRDTAFVSPPNTVIPAQIIRLPDGRLLVVGNGGSPQNYLAILNASTGAVIASHAANHLFAVTSAAVQADGKILSGSTPNTFSFLGALTPGFSRITQTGAVDDGFASFDSTVSAVAVDASGRIWVGGSFSTYNGVTQSSLAVLAGGDYDSRDGLLAPQTITFTEIADRTFGDTGNTLTLAATSDRGLAPITFSVTSGPATLSGNTLTITGAGSITVEASQAGDSTYAAATAEQTFTVAKAAQTIGFADPADRTTSSPAFELSATATSGLPVSFEVTGVATLGDDGKTLALTGATGSVTVTAKQAGNANYLAAPDVEQTFEVTAGTPQTITFNALPNRVVGAKFILAATATSGLPVSFAVTEGDATLGTDGKTVTVGSTAGTVTIRATQDGGTRNGVTYAAAEPVDQSFEVTLAPPTKTQSISFAPPAKATYGDAPLTLTATSSAGLPVAFSVVSGPASLEGDTLAFTGAGKVVVRASQAGDNTFKPAAAVSKTITVAKAVLTVNFAEVSRLVRDPNPPLTIESYEGFVGSDDATAIITAPTGSTRAAASSAAGVYPITLKGGLANNYTFAMGSGSVTVLGFAGAYEALLVDEAGTPRGKLELLVPNNALTYTGTLNLASEPTSISIRGNLAATDGESATGAWARAENPAKSVTALSLGFEIVGDTLDGELSGDNNLALSIGSGSRVFVQALDAKKKKIPSPWTGVHTLVLRDPAPIAEGDTAPLPLGAGHASVSVAATGVMTFKGKLADGAPLTGTARPAFLAAEPETTTGRFRTFLRPYGKRLDSFLSGELALEPHPDQTRFPGRHHVPELDGLLYWAKAGLVADKSYRGGFAADVVAIVDPWLAPAAKAVGPVPAATLAQRLDLVSDAISSAPVEISFSLAEAFDFGARDAFLPSSLTLSAKGAFSVPASLPAKADNPAFSIKVTPGTGAFTGSFTLSDIPEGKTKAVTRKVTISGTLRQGPDGAATLGHGHFLLDPSVNDTDTEQISGELVLTAPAAAP